MRVRRLVARHGDARRSSGSAPTRGSTYDPKLIKLVGSLAGEGITHVEYGRAGDHAGVDVFVEPTERGGQAGRRRCGRAAVAVELTVRARRADPRAGRFLLDECEVDRYRASGPGGQHRNKTESAVRLRHPPTGVSAIARGQPVAGREQGDRAAPAPREHFALEIREPIDLASYAPSPRLAAMVAGGTAAARREDQAEAGEYLVAMAELLDLFAAVGAEVAATRPPARGHDRRGVQAGDARRSGVEGREPDAREKRPQAASMSVSRCAG